MMPAIFLQRRSGPRAQFRAGREADAEEEERVEGLEVQRLISGGVLGGSGMPVPATCTSMLEREREREREREGGRVDPAEASSMIRRRFSEHHAWQ